MRPSALVSRASVQLEMPETMSAVEEAVPRSVEVPVLSILKSVVVAEAVEEPMAKSVELVDPLLAWTDNVPHGEDEATPIVPVVGSLNAVVVAGSVPYTKLPMLSWLFPVTEGKKSSLPRPIFPSPVVMTSAKET